MYRLTYYYDFCLVFKVYSVEFSYVLFVFERKCLPLDFGSVLLFHFGGFLKSRSSKLLLHFVFKEIFILCATFSTILFLVSYIWQIFLRF